MEANREVLILVDADVIIHLYKADKISLLNDLYPGRICMLDLVLEELRNNKTVRNFIENLFILKQAKEIKFPTSSNQETLTEYLMLRKTAKGKGESACLAYCKHYKSIIASSNTTDIRNYCEVNSIAYLTTLDLFAVALKRGKLTEVEIDILIGKITRNNESYLCCRKISDHLKFHFKSEKLLY
ncbi:MAG: hypothetical protein WCO02_03605 [Bacteroidota bacterium]